MNRDSELPLELVELGMEHAIELDGEVIQGAAGC